MPRLLFQFSFPVVLVCIASFMCPLPHSSADIELNLDDQAALLILRNLSISTEGSLSSWNGSSCGVWAGVTCDNSTGRVVALDLSGLGLSGPLPPSLCELSFLRTLILSDNAFSSTIPPCFSRLRALVTLDLSRNQLRGSLPPQLVRLRRLEVLLLSNNPGLVGQIPEWIGNFPTLAKLDLSSDFLEGGIPGRLLALRSLRELDLSNNQLTDTLKDFSQPLVSLNLASNQLTGSLPCFSASSASLSVLNLARNSIVGSVPTCISSLRSLTLLNLSSNGLQFRISPRLIFSDQLLVLDLSDNAISGPVPSGIVEHSDRSALLLLNLSHNRLYGEIPPEITELRSLLGLFLSHNQLTGDIPAAIGNLTYLQALDLSHNTLSGQIPISLAGCFQLWQLKLSHNNLSGTLRPELDALDSLRILDLASNRISGEIPLPLAGCKSLEVVDLSSNNIAGELSGAILKWQNLRLLTLAGNKLSGSLPDWLFSFQFLRSLDLSNNKLFGFIPGGDYKKSSEFTGDGRIILNHDNGLTGENVVAWGVLDLKGSRELELHYELNSAVGIDLSGNSLHGEIPQGLVELKGLEYLNLSYNHLAGRIPASLRMMGRLRRLDLSHNLLSGGVPMGISELRDLEALNLSYNCLTGQVLTWEEGLWRFPGAFSGNPGLCLKGSATECEGEAARLHSGNGTTESRGNPRVEGWMSVGAFWVSAAASFYVSSMALLCSPKEDNKVVVKRKTELGGMFSVASWILFVGLLSALLYQIITKRSIEVHRIVPANAPDLQSFVNDIELDITTVSSMSCSQLRGLENLVIGTPGSIDYKVYPLSNYVDYQCKNTSSGPTISLKCLGCQIPRRSHYIAWQFVDVPNNPASAVGFQFNLTAKNRDNDKHISFVSGTLIAMNQTSNKSRTIRGADLNILEVHLFPQIYNNLHDLKLIKPLVHDFVSGSSFSEVRDLQASLLNPNDGLINTMLRISYLSDYIVQIDNEYLLGIVSFLANAGGLYAISITIFLYLLVQCEARIKRLQNEDSIMREIKRQRRAQRNWEKLRKYVMYTWHPSSLNLEDTSNKTTSQMIDSCCGVRCSHRKQLSRRDSLCLDNLFDNSNETETAEANKEARRK